MPTSREPPSDDGCSVPRMNPDAITRHNLAVESLFSACNGVFMGMILFAAPVVLLSSWDLDLQTKAIYSAIILCAFPCGAFLGPLWAWLGRNWGMKKLVLRMAVWANLPLFLMFWVHDAALFTGIITVSQLLHSAMRMGMSSMYGVTYPRGLQGRVVGRLVFCTYSTAIPTVLLCGWLTDHVRTDIYRWLYPCAAISGLVACRFYALLRPLDDAPVSSKRRTLRSRILGVRRVVMSDRAYMSFELSFFLSGSAFFMSDRVVLVLAQTELGFGAFELSWWLVVLPHVLLSICSPIWGRLLDRIGIVRARMFINIIMTCYLASYFTGIMMGWRYFLYLGGVLRGMSEGGGQVTWALASIHFAPRNEDVPLYNGIHFVLNGIRGLLMPFVGSFLLLACGPWTVLGSTLVSAASIAVLGRSFRFQPRPGERRVVALVATDDQPLAPTLSPRGQGEGDMPLSVEPVPSSSVQSEIKRPTN